MFHEDKKNEKQPPNLNIFPRSLYQSETPRSFQEPVSASNSSDATGANPTVVFNATSSQNSLNASGIAGGLFYGAKFENATINVNFTSASKSSSN